MYRARSIVLALLSTSLLGGNGFMPVRYEVSPESRFWIDGTSTVGAYTCTASGVNGYGVFAEGEELAARLVVPVHGFDCGSGAQNRDFYRALQAEAYPTIEFDLERAEPLEAESQPGAPVRLRATGTLRIAGVGRRLTLTATGRRLAAAGVSVQGQQRLRMTDFGVEPPTHALGLIRAHDAIVARFDILATAR